MTLSLVLGGARSGKSGYAQRQAEQSAEAAGRPPVFIATAEAFDDEMRDRIARHQAERGQGWRQIEAPLDLAEAVRALSAEDVAVVDCLTLWLSNQMLSGRDLPNAIDELAAALTACPARLWVVSNEVGWSLVPDNPLGRRFRDEAGRLNQRIAALADEAWLIAAGMGLPLQRL
ncbi:MULTISPECIES: bifunctional adenosylcobinamide kinase/adenosylcobinamide-phosphate guanylyltransferase [Brevundimonas]|jgi:adenosylcobinamide kinase/adenosylcobinamide-phosphate guanylyltransferase|uniref:bifunctional adenosylcobinamide kinase/adenosylcobinamide-phosphate guanylyltransferase n=1 Tax=Brevundimonas TaxID=41275 RepID=UPI0019033B7D|nr:MULTISPECIES: bifunctional adenosylcobinamide kinase/adenosylcobinamide-phosphate guanylyltransferase [Brevundimonas]MDA0743042.1 bifunctional adenosylcobinamide kinase/adenosylcobinamide-phosphate guanylyltransferase [Pseudomonadota bacterium]MBK1968037.1 bifunctional adenosylcobinamide kinase/adenosylcobinamide-phosphate guanylyltransferase [Brevundimonas diminuta]MBK1974687.1 bifunctional adenosylcobinamide kinase/adenosylcobinamide-phosphate guanylyltransferase [Brevundimonas diminuta]MD